MLTRKQPEREPAEAIHRETSAIGPARGPFQTCPVIILDDVTISAPVAVANAAVLRASPRRVTARSATLATGNARDPFPPSPTNLPPCPEVEADVVRTRDLSMNEDLAANRRLPGARDARIRALLSV